MAVSSSSDSWIGASVLRKEDARHLLGYGMFIADLRIPGVQDVAFVRKLMVQAGLTEAAALQQYCLLALNTNEFVYLD